MNKALLLACLCLLISCPISFAEEITASAGTENVSVVQDGDYTFQLLDKIKAERNTIYNSLNMTPDQLAKKNAIDEKRYHDLEAPIKKLCLCRKKLKDISDSKQNKNTIKPIQKELESAREEIKDISNKYDKEFKKILTSEQKSKYSMIKKLKKADLKKLESKHKKASALRPFGVPVTQAEYTEQQKKEHCLLGKFKRNNKNKN